MNPTPYLSVVVATRDDRHGGDPHARLQAALRIYKKQAETLRFPLEYIIVDWNSPKGSQGIFRRIKKWSLRSRYLKIRVIEVPPAIHRKLDEAGIPFYQMIAKNVGIRRAKGEFILASNIDVFLDDSLMKFISERNLKKRNMYRSDRFDLKHKFLCEIPKFLHNDKSLGYLISRKNLRHASFNHFLPVDETRIRKLNLNPGTRPLTWDQRLKEKIRLLKKRFKVYGTPGYELHTNGCGDFTLLSREAWHRLCGYPEMRVFSFHLDSIFCQQAHDNGFTEIVLPFPQVHYHIDHADGWTPETGEQLMRRLKSQGIPFIEKDYTVFIDACRKTNNPMFNHEDWGLSQEKLKQCSV